MARADDQQRWQLERYRELLRTMARLHLAPELRGRLDSSDVIQNTLLNAQQHLDQFHGQSKEELLGWLHRILANSIYDEFGDVYGRGAIPRPREQSLEAALNESSQRLEKWLADTTSSPSSRVEKEEQLLLLAEALAQLPEDQRLAIELKYLQEAPWPLEEIGKRVARSPGAAGELIRRGVAKLRQILKATEVEAIMDNRGEAANRDERLEEVLAEYFRAKEAGASLDRVALLNCYPDLHAELETFFAGEEQLEGLAGCLLAVVPLGFAAPTCSVGEKRRDQDDPWPQIAGYQILSRLGRGGMGVVYKAIQDKLQRIVALKVLSARRLADADEPGPVSQ